MATHFLKMLLDEIRSERLSRAEAARALDLPLDAFLLEAERHGVPTLDYAIDDLAAELAAIRAAPRAAS